jgi:hypothetical protein
MPAHEAGALLDTRELGQCAIDSRPLPDSLGSLFKSIRAKLLSRLKLNRAECTSERGSKCSCDPEADERHHAWLVVGKFAPCPANEDEAAIKEDDCPKDGWNKL